LSNGAEKDRLKNAIKGTVKTERVKWYNEFEDYFRQTFYADHPDPNIPLIRFHKKEKKWYHYEQSGYYNEIDESDIDSIFMDWADMCGIDTQGKMRHMIRRLKARLKFSEIWDEGKYEGRRVDNILDGLIDLDTKEILPHTPAYFSKSQVPRHYIKSQTTIPAKLKKVYGITPDRDILHRFSVSVIQRHFESEGSLFLYGPRGAGKSTLLSIFPAIYGKDLLSSTPIQKLGSSFGLSQCYDKRLNVYADLPKTKLSANTVSVFKTLTGRDGEIEVNKKGTPQFNWLINCFFLWGCNQLMAFAKDATSEVESIMRRLAIVNCPTPQIKDEAFKMSMSDPDFLDQVFSYLMNETYEPLCDPLKADDYINENYRRWLMDSDPVMKIINEFYVFDDVPEYHDHVEGIDIYCQIPCFKVVEEVKEIMTKERIIVPGDLQADVTLALKSLKIFPNNKRGSNRMYLKVKRRNNDNTVGNVE